MMRTATPVFGQLAALADPTRCRMLLLLEQQALSVSEVCAIMQLPQSTVSRHLKVLVDEGWARARSEGASRVYRIAALSPSAEQLWQPVRGEVERTAAAQQDRQRLLAVLEQRRDRSAAFFSSAAGDWDRMRLELFGANAETLPLLALLGSDWVVGDLGCGTGHMARTLSPFVKRVIAVDASRAMLEAAAVRAPDNVELRAGRLEELPLATGEVDVALLFLVLHYVVDPASCLREAARVLKPGGHLLVVDMMPHDQVELRESMNQLWSGFSKEQMNQWLESAQLAGFQYIALPVDAQARGPALFAARSIKPTETAR
jgi:ArsR family transcriptional regulator